MIIYEIPRGIVLKFADNGIPFLSFDKFFNIAKLYRDDYFASQYVEGFIWEVGVRYNVWTHSLSAKYHRHVFFDQVRRPLFISFEIPHLERNATVSLHITIYDDDGVIFTLQQKLAFDVNMGDSWKVTSWRKIDPIRDCVLALCKNMPMSQSS